METRREVVGRGNSIHAGMPVHLRVAAILAFVLGLGYGLPKVWADKTPVLQATPPATPNPTGLSIQEFAVPAGSWPHDVAPALDGTVWYTAQRLGELGWLDPTTGVLRTRPSINPGNSRIRSLKASPGK